MDTKHSKYLHYASWTAVGGSAALLVYLGIRVLSKRKTSTELRGSPEISPIDNLQRTKRIPALAMFRDTSGDYLQYALNYTPKADPRDPSQMSDEDYGRLQTLGLISSDFPRHQIVVTDSPNRRNKFFVGYSRPFEISTKRDPLSVIQPEWAVSFEYDFETKSVPPSDIDADLFYNVALRTLLSEWMLTNRGIDGCHRGLSLSDCDLERSAILNLILSRWEAKQRRIDAGLEVDSVIYGPGTLWNGGRQFMSVYEGEIPEVAKDRFDAFYNSSFWQMPSFSGRATNFIHPDSMSSGGVNPEWIKRGAPLESNYLSEHPLLLGKAVFTNRLKNFK